MSDAKRWLGAAACAAFFLGCSDGDSEAPGESGPGTTPLDPGIHVSADDAVFQTDEFTLDAGEERFLCYARSLDEDLVVDGYSHEGTSFLHHVIFSRTTAPEPDGFSECDTLFRLTWEPLYLAGAGSYGIDFPHGMGHSLETGAQLLAQLHLLNTSSQPVTGSVGITMKRSTAKDPRPIGSFVFGSMNVNVPPAQKSTVEGDCTLDEKVQLIAVFPHMHTLGTSLKFETGPSADALTKVFERDPYNFDNQYIEPMDLTLSTGDVAHVTCNYDNPGDETITFGESTKSEMCFFIGFAVDMEGINACGLGGSGPVGDPVPVDPAAGKCGEHTPNAKGVGLPCTTDGNECPSGLMCTADYMSGADGICFQVGCAANADCGGEFITCCAPPQGGGSVQVCLPEACRIPECVPQPG